MENPFKKTGQTLDVKKGSIFGDPVVPGDRVRPVCVHDTFGLGTSQSGKIGIFSVQVGGSDPVLGTSKTEEDTSIRSANQLDYEFLLLQAALIPDPLMTPAELRALCFQTRLELKINGNTTLIDMPVWPLLAPAMQGAFAIGDTNAAAGTPVTYSMQGIAGAGPNGPSGIRYDPAQKIVLKKGAPLACSLNFKGTLTLGANRTCQFILLGLGALAIGG